MRPAQDFNRALGDVVREALAEARVPQREACLRTGIALTTLQRRMLGTSPFSVDELRSLATVAGTTDTSLLAAAGARVEGSAA